MKFCVRAVPLSAADSAVGRAEVFVLKSGGRIEGEHLNPQRTPGQAYLLRTGEGIRLALAEGAVQRVDRPNPGYCPTLN